MIAVQSEKGLKNKMSKLPRQSNTSFIKNDVYGLKYSPNNNIA